ncbi:MAG: TraB/GumN family protein [Candidatus Aenigmarchaeota archaeon]|nr:TraB/GumN family protein [Candidatus Aenigmarchaeota archaeon]
MTIYIVGTSHVAGESVSKVKKVILSKKPSCVAVELDYNRYVALKTREKGKGKIKMPLLQKAIFLVLRYVQGQLSKETNILPGEEMLAACECAEEVGAHVAFIDQDMNITLSKLMAKLGFFGQLKLLLYMGVGILGIPVRGLVMSKEIDLNKVPDDEFIEYAMGELRKHFPVVYEVLVDERNHVMARNLQKLGDEFEDVVAVMGAGHVKGVGKLLESRDKN